MMPELDIVAILKRIDASNLSKADKAVASIAIGQSWSTMVAAAMPELLRPGHIKNAQDMLVGFCKALEATVE